MKKARLEAFSDAVIAIILTIMVLELKVPHETELVDLIPIIPIFLSYVLSFIYLAIYWNNHHHLLQVVNQINGSVLWANMHLLFWLSLIPFVTAWIGENPFAPWPVALYGVVLLLSAIAYFILTRVLIYCHGKNSTLAIAIGRDTKGKISLVMYAVAIVLSFVNTMLACLLYASVAIMWLIPDSRLEKHLNS